MFDAADDEPTAFDDFTLGPEPQCVSPEEYAVVLAEAAENAAALGLDDLSAETVEARSALSFMWPLRQVGASDPGYHVISNYVDHAGPGALLDTACGARTYDGHLGIDIGLWPFRWLKVANSEVEVVAAAPGTIVSRRDGNFDQQCAWKAGVIANSVAVKHADGTTAYYFHMKRHSVTAKQVGDTVVAGERLGVVASSGFSTGPHLHFEVRDSANAVVDPFAGPCNPELAASLWASQPPYDDPLISKLTTGDAPVEIPACPGVEDPHIKTKFCRREAAVFTGYLRDLQAGATATFVVRRPDASAAFQWQAKSGQYSRTGYSWRSWTIPDKAPVGTWTLEGTYLGKTVKQSFTVAEGKDCAAGK